MGKALSGELSWGRSCFLLGFDAHESKQEVTNDVFLCKNSGLKDEMFML